MSYTFHKYGQGRAWGWWLEVKPSDAELVIDLHKQVSVGMFKRFDQNPHYKGEGAVALGAKWLQTIERFLASGKKVYVNQNGGMFAGNGKIPQEPMAVLHCNTLAFPPSQESIGNRKIDIKKWWGGTHYYLECRDKIIFSKEKFNTIDEARFEAEIYALPENIRLVAADHTYTHEGD
jgi:hypothetical protein